MNRLYKFLIIFFLITVVFIGYLVKKDINNLAESKSEQSKSKEKNSIFDEKALGEQEIKDIEVLKTLSTAKLTTEEVENLNKTARFLHFKQRIEEIFTQKKPYIEPKEFNELMTEVDRLREENYFFLGEAHAMKLELLKTQYTGDNLNKKIDDLVAETKSIDANEREKYNPMNDPEFRNFKEQEKRIVEQANSMMNFPNGLTKDEYIEQQIKLIY